MNKFSDIIRASGYRAIESFSGYSNLLSAVQRQMSELTHYYDDDTLRFFGCRVVKATSFDDGVYMGTICTQKRGFWAEDGRGYVIQFHDFTGNSIGPSGEREYFSTLRAAERAFYAFAGTLSARAVLASALEREYASAKRKADLMNTAAAMLEASPELAPEYAVTP